MEAIRGKSSIFSVLIFIVVGIVAMPSLAWGQTQPTFDELMDKGVNLLDQGKYAEALELFDQALEIDPNNIHGLSNKGTTLNKLEQYFEAWKYFGRVLEIMPDDSNAINGLSYANDRMYKPIDARLEVTARNSHGNLISYSTTTDIILLDHDFTKKHMDTWWIMKEIVARDGQDFEILQFSVDIVVTSDDRKFYSTSYVEDSAEQVQIIRGKYNGVPLDEGDVVNLFWTVFRPIE